MSHHKKTAVSNAEMKLLAIPIVFVMLRVWSILLTVVVSFDSSPCGLIIFFLIMGVS